MGEEHTRIVVNGQEYHSVDEMPPEVRAIYELAVGLGARQGQLADAAAAEQAPAGAPLPPPANAAHVSVNKVTTTRKYVVNGKEYASLDELPPELAEKVKQAMGSAETTSPQSVALPHGTGAAQPARTQPASRIPNFDAPKGSGVRVRVSALRLALWVAAILLIILLYLRRH